MSIVEIYAQIWEDGQACSGCPFCVESQYPVPYGERAVYLTEAVCHWESSPAKCPEVMATIQSNQRRAT